ncbi:MAG: replication factor C large subunit [Methanomassiliicoccales archaeon]|jgi:replication factor C large subunit|nr:replication factor C large subunit [Methanomassiliicoccales archaeon]
MSTNKDSGDWTEIYRPRTLDDIVGNPKAIQELKEWALDWENGHPKKKAAVLIGSPGTGKTSAALAVANDFGWGIIEMNASDQRNAEAIRKIALRGAMTDTFTDDGEFLSSKEGCLKLIVLDEADNIFGKEDYGGIPAIVELIKATKQPVILIVNDFYALSKRSGIIKSETKQIKFNRLHPNSIKSVLKKIMKDRGLRIDEKALELIASNANGDLRSAIRDLQAVALGRTEVKEKNVAILNERQIMKSMYDLLVEILHGTNPDRARSVFMEVNEAPDYVMLWIDENIPLEYRDHNDLYHAYHILSRSDVFLGRVRKRQYYGFWSYAIDLMTYGVCASKKRKYKEFAKYRFPLYLMKMSRSRSLRTIRDNISAKLGALCHCSASTARDELLPYIQYVSENDREFVIRIAIELGLDAEELAFLLNEKIDSNKIRHLLTEIQKVTDIEKRPIREIEIEASYIASDRSAEDEQSTEDQPTRQRSLFEY